MLVEMINQQAAEGTTDPTVFGPFHVPDAPMKEMGDTILVDDDPGPELTFRGTVRDLDGNLLDGAELDVWQGASNGLYNVQDRRPVGDQPARPVHDRRPTVGTSSAPSDPSPTPCPATGRSARCSAPTAATTGAPPTRMSS